MKKISTVGSVFLIAVSVLTGAAFAQKPAAKPGGSGGKSGTTLSAYKTVDIRTVSDAQGPATPAVWRYFGLIAAWNQGAVDTEGLAINDVVEYKQLIGPNWRTICVVPEANFNPKPSETSIPAGTTEQTATIFSYFCEAPPPPTNTVRNTAHLTITNHSGHLGEPFGPSPKASFEGDLTNLPYCDPGPNGCTYTQGYWKNHPEGWPAGYDPSANFFLSGKRWLEVLGTPSSASQGYYQLAHQYIAAVLNAANGASVPQGVQDTLDLATAWLNANEPSACTVPSSCGTQKTWAAVLDTYNKGEYPGGPPHCE